MKKLVFITLFRLQLYLCSTLQGNFCTLMMKQLSFSMPSLAWYISFPYWVPLSLIHGWDVLGESLFEITKLPFFGNIRIEVID